MREAILICYQDDLCMRSILEFLEKVRYRVETARAMRDIIQKVRTGDIDVVLLEDDIEGVEASDIVRLLKKIETRIQIIAISSEESLSSARRLRSAGIFYQAMKPVDLEEVKAAVECAFEKIGRETLGKGSFSFFHRGSAPALAEGV